MTTRNDDEQDFINLIASLKEDEINTVEYYNNGEKLLHMLMVYEGYYKSLDLFLSNPNIDINVTDNSKNTALHYAAIYGNLSKARKLIAKKIDINAKNESGNTALHYAVKHNNMQIARELVIKGSKFTENNSGKTALDLDHNGELKQELYDLFGPPPPGKGPPGKGPPGKGPPAWTPCDPNKIYEEDDHPCYNKGGRRKRKSRKRKTITRRKRKTTTTRRKRNNRKKRT